MKTSFLIPGCLIAFALGNFAHSQAPVVPQTPRQRLEALKAANQLLLDRQVETLKKLEDLQLQSQQLKFFGKRS